jgi:hypothetical protein
VSSSFTNQTTNFDAGVGNAYGYWANETINVGGFDFEGATLGMVEYVYAFDFHDSILLQNVY